MNTSILPVAEYNANQISLNMVFRNAKNERCTRGFVVVLENGNAQYFKSRSAAEKFSTNPVIANEETMSPEYALGGEFAGILTK